MPRSQNLCLINIEPQELETRATQEARERAPVETATMAFSVSDLVVRFCGVVLLDDRVEDRERDAVRVFYHLCRVGFSGGFMQAAAL